MTATGKAKLVLLENRDLLKGKFSRGRTESQGVIIKGKFHGCVRTTGTSIKNSSYHYL